MSYGSEIGCPGWIRTSTVPLNRRTDYCYPTEQKSWSPRQDLHLRSPGPRPGMLLLHYAVLPRLVWERSRGLGSLWTRGMAAPWPCRRVGDWRPRWDLHPHSSRRQRVAFLFSYESEMVGSAGNAPVRHFQFCLTTLDLQSSNRITSRIKSESRSKSMSMSHKLVAGVGITLT